MRLVGLGLVLVACNGGETGDSDAVDRVAAVLALTGDPVAGEAVYAQRCQGCHSQPAAFAAVPPDFQASAILDGVGAMSSFAYLSDQEIADILAYIDGA